MTYSKLPVYGAIGADLVIASANRVLPRAQPGVRDLARALPMYVGPGDALVTMTAHRPGGHGTSWSSVASSGPATVPNRQRSSGARGTGSVLGGAPPGIGD